MSVDGRAKQAYKPCANQRICGPETRLTMSSRWLVASAGLLISMTKTEDLAQALIAVLDASSLGRDEKVKAIGIARAHVNHPDVVGFARVFSGPVGSAKKNELLLKTIEEREIEARKKKRSRKPA